MNVLENYCIPAFPLSATGVPEFERFLDLRRKVATFDPLSTGGHCGTLFTYALGSPKKQDNKYIWLFNNLAFTVELKSELGCYVEYLIKKELSNDEEAYIKDFELFLNMVEEKLNK